MGCEITPHTVIRKTSVDDCRDGRARRRHWMPAESTAAVGLRQVGSDCRLVPRRREIPRQSVLLAFGLQILIRTFALRLVHVVAHSMPDLRSVLLDLYIDLTPNILVGRRSRIVTERVLLVELFEQHLRKTV